MKVLMVGDTQSGKTTFMGAMYATMADDEAYCIQCNQDESGLRRIAKNLKRGVYPNMTQTRAVYDFTFRYNYEGTFFDFFDFQWLDYRGGAIRQTTDDPIARDLQENLKEAETLIVFVDSTRLEESNMSRQWRRLKQFILNFAGRADENHPLSLIVVLTKIDLVDSPLETDVGKKILETIKELSNNKYLHGMLCWSSITGETLGATFFPFIHAMKLEMARELKRQFSRYSNRGFWAEVGTFFTGNNPELDRFKVLNVFFEDMNERLKNFDGKLYALF